MTTPVVEKSTSVLPLSEMLQLAFKEDMPRGDVTTDGLALIGTRHPTLAGPTAPKLGLAKLIAKQDLVLSGQDLFQAAVLHFDPTAQLTWHFQDGQSVLQGQSVCRLKTDLVGLLKAERVALNLLMHLSGIATLTSRFVAQVRDYHCRILDTRKTTPLFRHWEKRAVRHGGGHNHRMDLSSAILIKDNHIAMVGGITKAVRQLRSTSTLPIEVEAGTLEQVKECVELQIERILLDNMDLETLRQARSLIPKSISVEASGNMTLERVRSVALIGVNDISVGALTHSAPAADLSLLFEWEST